MIGVAIVVESEDETASARGHDVPTRLFSVRFIIFVRTRCGSDKRERSRSDLKFSLFIQYRYLCALISAQ